MNHCEHTQASDELREAFIGECGQRMLAAHAAGDMAAARFWLSVQADQIGQRSPAIVARMEARMAAPCGSAQLGYWA